MAESTILEMEGIHKTFGPVVALNDVHLQLKRGEVLGLLGGNGAGKTTLMNVLFGLYRADRGDIRVDGRTVQIQSPRDAIQYGIGMVHQHFLQVPDFTVAQNIVLGTNLPNRPTMQLNSARDKIRQLSTQFGLDLEPDAPLSELPMGIRQRVEIVKALYRGITVLILDEPTTMLTPQEVDTLFASLRDMVDAGLSVIFISHKLPEVLRVCDRITVLRHGQNIVTLERADATEEALVQGMVGDELDVGSSILFSKTGLDQTTYAPGERPVVEVQDLTVEDESGRPVVKNCSFTIREQEILGLAGVAGNGQRELAESLLAIRPIAQGSAMLNGVDVARSTTRQLLESGVAYVPEDRWGDGFLPKATVAHNLILGQHRRSPYSNGRFLNWPDIFRRSRELIQEFNIKTGGPEDLAANLSGGNIQRAMLARAFASSPQVMILHNPTQGLDIPSIEFVYNKLLAHRRKGLAALLISENLDELFLLCNRIAVIYNGEIMDILDRSRFDKYLLGRLMSGVRSSE